MGRGAVKWDDLRVFLEVARQGTVHAAAKKLKLDHSTVCRDIWVSVRKEQGALTRIRSVMKFLTHIFETDRAFLLGSRSGGDHGRA